MTTNLTQPEQEALLTLSFMAALADGGRSDLERAEVKRITESLPSKDLNPPALLQRVLLREVTLGDAVAPLSSPEARQLACEMAVCVCEADNALNVAEQRFLADLRRELRLNSQAVASFQQQADALGQVAQRYYAGGRQLSALQLQELFSSLTEQARSLHGRYAGVIQQRASTLNPGQLLNLVQGQQADDPIP